MCDCNLLNSTINDNLEWPSSNQTKGHRLLYVNFLFHKQPIIQQSNNTAVSAHMQSNMKTVIRTTRRALGRVPPTKVFRQLAVNKTILKSRIAAAMGGQYVYVEFSRRNKIPHCSAYTISEKAIRFRHPNYNPDRAQSQKLISSSMSRHLSTRNISSKSMHAFLSNFANRQTDKHRQKHLPPPLSEVITTIIITIKFVDRQL